MIFILIVGKSKTSGWRIDWDHPFCKYPCGKASKDDIDATSENSSQGIPYCNQPNELLTNSNDCQSYFQCDHGRASKMRCPGELTFDDEKKTCISSTENSRSECKSSENNYKAESMKQPSIKMFCNSRVEKGEVKVGIPRLYPSIENPCRLYYICISGGHHQMGSCPIKQSFDPSKKKCEPTKNVPTC